MSSPFFLWGDPPFPTSFDAAHEARSRSHCNTLMATSGRGDRGGHVATGQTASWDSHVQLGTVSTADRSLQLYPVPTPSLRSRWAFTTGVFALPNIPNPHSETGCAFFCCSLVAVAERDFLFFSFCFEGIQPSLASGEHVHPGAVSIWQPGRAIKQVQYGMDSRLSGCLLFYLFSMNLSPQPPLFQCKESPDSSVPVDVGDDP